MVGLLGVFCTLSEGFADGDRVGLFAKNGGYVVVGYLFVAYAAVGASEAERECKMGVGRRDVPFADFAERLTIKRL